MSVSSSLWHSPFLAPRLGWKMAHPNVTHSVCQAEANSETLQRVRPPFIGTYRTVERSAALAACLASSLAAWAARSALSAL